MMTYFQDKLFSAKMTRWIILQDNSMWENNKMSNVIADLVLVYIIHLRR